MPRGAPRVAHASGFERIKEFAKRPKHRRNAQALSLNQGMRVTNWAGFLQAPPTAKERGARR